MILRQQLQTDILSVFHQIVESHPNAVAIRWTRDISYQELDRMSDNLAFTLLGELGDTREPVPFLLEQGPRPIISILGILKAGKSYVALKPNAPIAYQRNVLRKLGARTIIVEHDDPSLEIPTIKLQDSLHSRSALKLPSLVADSLATTIFTSGSTGKPKSFQRSHKAILHRAFLYQQEHQLAPGDRQGLTAACHFVASETDIFGTLLSGATLCPYPLPQLNISHFKSWLTNEEITLLHPPVGFFRRFLGSLENQRHFPALRLVALGGEPIYRADILKWQERFSLNCRLCHRYSSSEAGNISTLNLTANSKVPWQQIPAGFVCSDKEVRIESQDGKTLANGEIGEVVVYSDFLSMDFHQVCCTGDLGSLNTDGLLTHHGRQNRETKVRGHRVDLQAIEALLLERDDITEAKVQVENEQLVAYLVSSSVTPESLRAELEQRLLPEAVPNLFHMRSALVLSDNGKVADQGSLASVPRTLEDEISAIWSRILQSHVSPTDNFFSLGGTSLMAAQAILEMESLNSHLIHASVLSLFPTPRSLAAQLEQPLGLGNIVPIRSHGSKTPFFLVHPNSGQTLPFYRLASRLDSEQPFFCFRAFGLNQGEKPHTGIFQMAQDYSRQLRETQPKGPYRIGGRCMGAVIALEMARILEGQGQEIEKLILFDAAPPSLRTSSLKALTRRTNEVLVWLHHHAKSPSHILRRVYHRLTMSRRWNHRGTDDEPQTRALEVFTHLGHLLFLHESNPYEGDAVFFSGSSPITEGWLAGWKRIIKGQLQVIHVPGDHGQILQEPYVRETAEKLDQLLNCQRRK